MPRVLTTRATIKCPHQAPGISTPSLPIWDVQGGMALLENDVGTIPACPYLIYPCVGYRLQSMGLNATTVMGRKVILETDFQLTFTGLPLTITESHDTYDDSTPAAIPAGQPAPPPSPEMLDRVAPIVVAAPPALVYSLTTQVPVPPLIFTLLSAFPLKWVLTLIKEPTASHSDLTGGDPPNILVAPSGGEWDTPSLPVTVTFSPTYLNSLAPGLYRLFMTGVSQRGLSGFAEVVLTVSA